MTKEGIFLIVLGLLVSAASSPRLRAPFVSRLVNEGLASAKPIKPRDAEILKFAGPNFSMLIIGGVLILAGIIISR